MKALLIKTEGLGMEGDDPNSHNFIVIRGIMDGRDLNINIYGNKVYAQDDIHLDKHWEGYKVMGKIEVPDTLITEAKIFVETQKALALHLSFIESSLSF